MSAAIFAQRDGSWLGEFFLVIDPFKAVGAARFGVKTGAITEPLTIPWSAASGSSAQTINVDLRTVGGTGGVNQFATTSEANGQVVNGSSFGSVTCASVACDGAVTAKFSNGVSQNVYKVPIATFPNSDSLIQLNGNAYTTSATSSVVNINPAAGGTGTTTASLLEGSSVDLSTEFTHLIAAQNADSATAPIITAADQMLQSLEQIPV